MEITHLGIEDLLLKINAICSKHEPKHTLERLELISALINFSKDHAENNKYILQKLNNFEGTCIDLSRLSKFCLGGYRNNIVVLWNTFLINYLKIQPVYKLQTYTEFAAQKELAREERSEENYIHYLKESDEELSLFMFFQYKLNNKTNTTNKEQYLSNISIPDVYETAVPKFKLEHLAKDSAKSISNIIKHTFAVDENDAGSSPPKKKLTDTQLFQIYDLTLIAAIYKASCVECGQYKKNLNKYINTSSKKHKDTNELNAEMKECISDIETRFNTNAWAYSRLNVATQVMPEFQRRREKLGSYSSDQVFKNWQDEDSLMTIHKGDKHFITGHRVKSYYLDKTGLGKYFNNIENQYDFVKLHGNNHKLDRLTIKQSLKTLFDYAILLLALTNSHNRQKEVGGVTLNAWGLQYVHKLFVEHLYGFFTSHFQRVNS